MKALDTEVSSEYHFWYILHILEWNVLSIAFKIFLNAPFLFLLWAKRLFLNF